MNKFDNRFSWYWKNVVNEDLSLVYGKNNAPSKVSKVFGCIISVEGNSEASAEKKLAEIALNTFKLSGSSNLSSKVFRGCNSAKVSKPLSKGGSSTKSVASKYSYRFNGHSRKTQSLGMELLYLNPSHSLSKGPSTIWPMVDHKVSNKCGSLYKSTPTASSNMNLYSVDLKINRPLLSATGIMSPSVCLSGFQLRTPRFKL